MPQEALPQTERKSWQVSSKLQYEAASSGQGSREKGQLEAGAFWTGEAFGQDADVPHRKCLASTGDKWTKPQRQKM